MTDAKRTDNLITDCRLAAHLLHVTGTFETGQAILRDAASEIMSMSDALADMTRQRDEARAEGFAAGLEAAAKVAGSLLVRARFGTGEIATEVVYSDFVAAAINALAEEAKP